MTEDIKFKAYEVFYDENGYCTKCRTKTETEDSYDHIIIYCPKCRVPFVYANKEALTKIKRLVMK